MSFRGRTHTRQVATDRAPCSRREKPEVVHGTVWVGPEAPSHRVSPGQVSPRTRWPPGLTLALAVNAHTAASGPFKNVNLTVSLPGSLPAFGPMSPSCGCPAAVPPQRVRRPVTVLVLALGASVAGSRGLRPRTSVSQRAPGLAGFSDTCNCSKPQFPRLWGGRG